jgi:peptide deformylase
MEELKLIPPTDPRVQTAIAPFQEDMLKEEGFKDRKELSDTMFDAMKKYGGIGLTCNQVGLPFNMFVLGDHLQLENGLKMACFNPMIISSSEETTVDERRLFNFSFCIFINYKTS